MEYMKFEDRRAPYRRALAEIQEMGFTFFDEHPHVQFKIVFMDSGTYEVTRTCLPYFWPRLLPGGVMILDQFNHEISPGETRAVREYLPDVPVHTYGFTNHPSAYIVKPAAH